MGLLGTDDCGASIGMGTVRDGTAHVGTLGTVVNVCPRAAVLARWSATRVYERSANTEAFIWYRRHRRTKYVFDKIINIGTMLVGWRSYTPANYVVLEKDSQTQKNSGLVTEKNACHKH